MAERSIKLASFAQLVLKKMRTTDEKVDSVYCDLWLIAQTSNVC